jgi:hypothetical protein
MSLETTGQDARSFTGETPVPRQTAIRRLHFQYTRIGVPVWVGSISDRETESVCHSDRRIGLAGAGISLACAPAFTQGCAGSKPYEHG